MSKPPNHYWGDFEHRIKALNECIAAVILSLCLILFRMNNENAPNERSWVYSFTLAKKVEEQKNLIEKLQFENGQIGLKFLVTARKERKFKPVKAPMGY
jgi:hypothetical protein